MARPAFGPASPRRDFLFRLRGRAREVEDAVIEGDFAPLSPQAVLAITIAAVLLGLMTFALVVAQA